MVDTLAHEHGEVSLRDLVAFIWAKRWFILSITILATLAAGVSALVVDKRYRATVTLSPATSSGSSQLGALGSLASQFGGVASLAGISLPGNSKRSESLAILQSEALTEDYVRKNDLLPVLYEKQWDPLAKKWKVTDPKKMPTLWKANQYFKNDIRAVTTDSKTDLVTLTVTWKDPELAARWANGLVRMANDYARARAVEESERNIAYLLEQASKTDALGVKQAIYSILQSEINKEMLARGNNEYALKVLDPAFTPEKPSSPKLALWLIMGFFGGLFSALFIVFVRNAWRSGNVQQR
jgi:uncharacterized protein involved in exopolysaccharide biosynthesis